MTALADPKIERIFRELQSLKSAQVLHNARKFLQTADPQFVSTAHSEDEILKRTAELSASAKGLCFCTFKANTGKAKVDEALSSMIQSSIRLLPETSDTLIVPVAGQSYKADAYFFKVNNNYYTYKIDGSTCTRLLALHGAVPEFETCVNLAASILGKRPPYLVPNTEFGAGRHNEGW